MVDLVLSSGFLAFPRHVGFLDVVAGQDEHPIDAIVGTSSGALVGSLFAAGHSPDEIASIVCEFRPVRFMRFKWTPWRGVLSLEPLIGRLSQFLPSRFEQLVRPLGVGVCDESGAYRLLTSGPLPESVVASCAMPYVFQRIRIQDQSFSDGGAADRLGLSAFRAWRGPRRALVHQVARTAGRDVLVEVKDCVRVKTPRSGGSFLSLGDFEAKRREARELTQAQLGDSGYWNR